ncbi:hypothetical protein [Streptomyces mirabilis]
MGWSVVAEHLWTFLDRPRNDLFSEEELPTLGDALGHPVRQIRANI